jgi:hypothetical protein
LVIENWLTLVIKILPESNAALAHDLTPRAAIRPEFSGQCHFDFVIPNGNCASAPTDRAYIRVVVRKIESQGGRPKASGKQRLFCAGINERMLIPKRAASFSIAQA